MISSIFKIFYTDKNRMKINISDLPSQGYFYPENMEIWIQKGNIDDQIEYRYGLNNSNIFGIIDTIKKILKSKITIKPNNYSFNKIRGIDIFFMFLTFVKFTTGKDIPFNGINFGPNNFAYFDFDQYEKNYDKETRQYEFDGWKFSLPSIGIETSLNHFSYELAIRGKSEQYQDRNYNLIYFLGEKSELGYDEMINLIETFEDLDDSDQQHINDIVKDFDKAGIYFLIEKGKQPTRINPHMLKNIWTAEE